MSKKNGIPGFFGKNIAMQAERRYLSGKKPEGKRVEENRSAAADVISVCYMMALNDLYGIGETRLYKVMDAANAEAARFSTIKKKAGMDLAKMELYNKLGRHDTYCFLLPVVTPPRNRREWDMLAERRDAAETVVRFYIIATKKVLGFGPDRLEKIVRATEENFREFGAYAKDGDYYGYNALAQRLEQLFHTPVGVLEEDADEPIFGESLT